MTDDEATKIANEWIDAWNSHDLDRILSHYSDDVELTSPLVSRVLGDGQGTVTGKPALRAYFLRALETFPDLRFDFWGAYPGHESLVVHYESVRKLRAAELMKIDGSGRVSEVIAHYASPTAVA
ncbi:MAG: nuclear transport factor 2 family protein [bacterium]